MRNTLMIVYVMYVMAILPTCISEALAIGHYQKQQTKDCDFVLKELN